MVVDFNIKDLKDLKKDSLLIYNGKKFEAITKEKLLKDLSDEFKELKNTNDNQNTIIENQNKKIMELQEKLHVKINSFIEVFTGKGKR